jgi:hypothetical protein
MYILSNSNQKLKNSFIDSAERQMPIPLYIASFQSIFDPKPTLQLNSTVKRFKKEAMTVYSIGLHSEDPEK